MNDLEHVYFSGNKENPAIVFLHGFPYDHTMWDKQVEYLKDEFCCITYDIRGLGENRVSDGQFTMETLVDDLFEVIERTGVQKPIICGLSMGGYICLRAVERNQQAFSALVLCDTKSAADDNAGRVKRASAIKAINTDGLEKYVTEAVTGTFAGETIENDRPLFDSVLERAKASDPVGVKGCILAMMGRTDTTDLLKHIELPTLLLCGSFDKLTPPMLMCEMHEKIRGSEFAVAPRSAHMSPLENPGFVNDVIKGFCRRVNVDVNE